jgi:hypothetical protein
VRIVVETHTTNLDTLHQVSDGYQSDRVNESVQLLRGSNLEVRKEVK